MRKSELTSPLMSLRAAFSVELYSWLGMMDTEATVCSCWRSWNLYEYWS